MKYRKILLAYNGSQDGKRALFECADLAAFLQAETHLLAVASMPPSLFLTEGFVPEARPMDMTNAAAKENIPATPLVAGAYGFIWLAVLVYVGTVAARAGRLTKEVAVLQQKLNQVDPGGR